MVRYVALVSNDPCMARRVSSVLASDARFIVSDSHQAHCRDPITNIYSIDASFDDWVADVRPASPSGTLPDGPPSSVMLVECRLAEWTVEVGKLLAHGLEHPAWFIDNAGVVWPIGDADSTRIDLG